jgi:hypothetical protein
MTADDDASVTPKKAVSVRQMGIMIVCAMSPARGDFPNLQRSLIFRAKVASGPITELTPEKNAKATVRPLVMFVF